MAMALEISVTEFYRLAGHTGSEVVFPWLAEPLCRRGFHIQEAVFVAVQLGYSMTPFELFPQLAASPSANPHPPGANTVMVGYGGDAVQLGNNWIHFTRFIASGRGVIECKTKSSNWHAVAYDDGHIFNPEGEAFPYSRANCESRGLFTHRLWQLSKTN